MQLHLSRPITTVGLLYKLIFLYFCIWPSGLQQSLTFVHLTQRELYCMQSPPRTHGSCWG